MYVADIEEAVAVVGPRFVQIYGQGESPMTITALSRAMVADRSHPRWRERLGSVGIAQSCVEIRIGDEDGQRLPVGETGEVLVRGAPVMLGYWRNPEATTKTIRDGWLWTGDVGSMDDDGFLTLKDRSKDVIISGGTNIYPREVEEVLLLHPTILEVSVVGRPSAEWGEDVVAFVVARPGANIDIAELDRHCVEHIARFKRPKLYVVEKELPKNNYGKVLKTELRARLVKTADVRVG
jgi:long-chain acyl-CoA synthetase